MKERPIAFNDEMVRAILGGYKTQTRRVIKSQPDDMTCQVMHFTDGYRFTTETKYFKCPYGVLGDKLWVRETFRYYNRYSECACYDYCCCPSDKTILYRAASDHEAKWKPPMHMPRNASRIDLLIKNIRVERIKDISEKDAKAEGVVPSAYESVDKYGKYYSELSHVLSFARLWNSIYAKRGHGWNSNPWVWVVEFEIIQ